MAKKSERRRRCFVCNELGAGHVPGNLPPMCPMDYGLLVNIADKVIGGKIKINSFKALIRRAKGGK